MANRFTPSVRPTSGGGFDPNAITAALAMYQAQRQDEADRRTADEDRQRRRAIEDEELEYLRGQRQQQADQQAIANHEAGVRPAGTRTLLEQERGAPDVAVEQRRPQAPAMVGGVSPLAQRMAELQAAMSDPRAAAQPTRAARRTAGMEALKAETAAYQALPSGAHRDLRETPEAREQQRLAQMGEHAASVGQGLGADPALLQHFRVNPDALGAYLTHEFTTRRQREQQEAQDRRNRETQAAQDRRARETQEAITRRAAGGGEGGGSLRMSPQQAYALARQIVGDPSPFDEEPRNYPLEIETMAQQLMSGSPIAAPPQFDPSPYFGDQPTSEPPTLPPAVVQQRGAPPPQGPDPAAGFAPWLDAAANRILGGLGGAAMPSYMEEVAGYADQLTDDELRAEGLTDAQIREVRQIGGGF